MKIFIKGLNPCAARRTNLKQYYDYLILNGHEVVSSPEESECVLIWGCGFRTDYRDNSISEANRYKNELKKEVVLAGCIPDIDPNFLKKNFHGKVMNWREDDIKIKQIFGCTTKNLDEIPMILGKDRLCEDANEYKKNNPGKDACYLDEQIQLYISEGCRLTCSYCSEKLMFPPYQSYSEKELIATCEKLVKNEREKKTTGKIKIMFQADSAGDYGKDIGSSLPCLIRKIMTIDPDLIIGMQGLNPTHFLEYFDEMIDFIQKGIIDHLRLPIQSASSNVLKLMQRPYKRKDINKIFFTLNKINFKNYSTDVIVGFPGETLKDYNETIKFILEYHPTYVLLSSYMDFVNLPAYNLSKKICDIEKERRLMNADKMFTEAGIYCCTDGGKMNGERRKRLNSDYRI